MPHPLVVNKRHSEYDVYCGRGSVWGNDWTHLPLVGTKAKFQCDTREESIERHKEWFLKNKILIARARRELRGLRLACYCAPLSCHVDIIAEVSNCDKWPMEIK